MDDDENVARRAKNKRTLAKAACTRARNFIDGIGDRQVSVIELRQRQAKFREIWQDFNDAQENIEFVEKVDEHSISHNEERESFEDKYFAVEAKFEELIIERTTCVGVSGPSPFGLHASPEGRDNDQHQDVNMRLPRIELPMFSGVYEEWRPFYDIFRSMIHENTKLPAVQKMHYLRASLKGEAADVISSLELTSENYVEAWAMLNERYDNQRVIVQKHIKAIFDHPVLHRESHVELRQLLDTVLKHLRALKVLKRCTDKWDDLIIHIITSKLAPTTNKEWETSLTGSNIPTLQELTDFLSHRCRALEAIDRKPPPSVSTNKVERPLSRKATSANISIERLPCEFCKGDHLIFHCAKFLELSAENRFQEVKGRKLCLNCLKSASHRANQCNAGACRKCNRKHNTLLHMNARQQPTPAEPSSSEAPAVTQATTSSVNHASQMKAHHVLLSTAIVHVRDAKGNMLPCRALLDNGSQSNFITADLVKALGLKQIPTNIPINGVGESRAETHSCVKVGLKSRLNAFKAELPCLVLRKITQDLPSISINKSDVRIPPGITPADPDFLSSSKIDMLLGVESFWNIICVGQIKATESQPCWQKTHFGWIAAGRILTRPLPAGAATCALSINDELSQALTRFWEIEHDARSNTMSPDERRCEAFFESTFARNERGRFIVKLPIKEEEMSRLGQSKDTAVRRFKNLERRLDREPTLKRDYAAFIHEYQTLGHMREVLDHQPSVVPHYYLPHHCVLKADNATTKLRVVFDASCKTSSGISLNDALMVGPVLQQDLFSIIARFRTFRYVLIADIAKMYRQVLVDEEQVPLQRIVWRCRADQPIKEYELLTVTYGTGPASFLAIKSLRTLAEIEATRFPIGSQVALRDFYVDDLITGASSREDAIQIRDEVTRLLDKGGFVLRKWASNDVDLLHGVPESSTANSTRSLDKGNVFKTLGIQWSPENDSFQYTMSTEAECTKKVTKRVILSCVAQIFDPLGLLGPVILLAKTFIQRLWMLRLDWDESIPLDLYTEWSSYRTQMKQLSGIRIPRMVISEQRFTRVELHGFCDASQLAYGACVYTRVTDENGLHHTYLVCSKSRVAPLKAISVPRLELCGAQLLAQLIDKVVRILDLKIEETYYWTDATIVLSWISSPSRNFNTFVANRVGNIQELTAIKEWHHVKTDDNPADILSRGANPNALNDSLLWWKGPKWLCEDKSDWPKTMDPVVETNDLPEIRSAVLASSVTHEEFDIIERFSSYGRLTRVVATCLRFVKNARCSRDQRETTPLLAHELEMARKRILNVVQRIAFPDEINALKDGRPIVKGSRLLSLNPFLDSDGLLRVGGRLINSSLPYVRKHPIILPAHHRLTTLIIEDEHKKLLHAGPIATLSAVRARYWPLSARGITRSIIHKCIVCFKAKPRASRQVMGDLPSVRVTPSRPFSKVGVDYCGPVFVKEGKRRNAKRSKAWICIFVCMATKAVHLELVSDLTAEGFLNALKRFISRRGKPTDIFSDNGTNFVGANKELQDLHKSFNKEAIRNRIVNDSAADGTSWHFNPPRAPHFGGLWEAAVRSTKHHLARVAADGSLTFEEASTLLCRIEAILNSRPLTPLTSDPEDTSYLTPGHFLIGDSLVSYPEPSLQDVRMNRLSRWQRLEQIRQHFWKRWSSDYLSQLQQRTKWQRDEGPPLQLGQLVVVRESELPPQSWLVGRIATVHPGADSKVRTASIRTSRGIFKRPASKICILPIET